MNLLFINNELHRVDINLKIKRDLPSRCLIVILPRHQSGTKELHEKHANQWSVPAILLSTKNADYENEKCFKIRVFICILHSKQRKDTPF